MFKIMKPYNLSVLPQDNPADFSYFFDTSRRRTCYIAPERFVDSSWRNQAESVGSANIDLTDSEVKQGELTPAMDIFSVGLVIKYIVILGHGSLESVKFSLYYLNVLVLFLPRNVREF